jgi:hypothetical protein
MNKDIRRRLYSSVSFDPGSWIFLATCDNDSERRFAFRVPQPPTPTQRRSIIDFLIVVLSSSLALTKSKQPTISNGDTRKTRNNTSRLVSANAVRPIRIFFVPEIEASDES